MSTSDILRCLFVRLSQRIAFITMQGQAERSNRSSTLAIGETQLASVSLHNLERDGEAETGPIIFGGIERVHCVAQSGRSKTSPFVHDVDAGEAVLARGADGYESAVPSGMRSCVHCILHEIVEYLEQLSSVCCDETAGCGLADDLDAFCRFLLSPCRSGGC